MEGLIPEIRLKSGSINFPNGLKLEFVLGLVFNLKGSYILELHFDEKLALKSFYREHEKSFFSSDYQVEATTTDGEEFIATKVWMKSFPFNKSMGDFYCNGEIRLKQISQFPDGKSNDEKLQENVHFVVVEGLELKYDSHSKFQGDDFGKNNKHFFDKDGRWDYTTVTFQVEDLTSYQFIVYNRNEDQVVLEFQSEYQYQPMTYSFWKEIFVDFMEFLSFLNGARVTVREEHFGQFWTPQNLRAEVSVYYSREKNLPRRRNDFMAINNVWFRSDYILHKAFLQNFRIYREKNKKWNLNTIIFYLCNAEQTQSIGDKIFIQTILLERLSNTYAEILDKERMTLIPNELFNDIHSEMFAVLSKYKSQIPDSKFNTLKGRLKDVNKVKSKNTIVKFKNLIEGVGIEISDNIEQLLIKRHRIIHKGDIGEFKEALSDFELMDKLIRKIIINIIEYSGPTIQDGKHFQTPPKALVKDIED